jgi:RimJ/RimL family protein N-acetyltransferase
MNKIKKFDQLILEELELLLELPLTREKIQIFSKNDYEENKQIRHYKLSEESIVIVPPSLMDHVIHVVKSKKFDKEKPMEYLKDTLALKNHSFTDETMFLFLDPKDHSLTVLDSDYEIIELEDTMTDVFETFENACSQEDLDEGLVSLADSLVLGCFHKKKLVGVASYWFLTDHLADIGVVVLPDYRKKGIGKA